MTRMTRHRDFNPTPRNDCHKRVNVLRDCVLKRQPVSGRIVPVSPLALGPVPGISSHPLNCPTTLSPILLVWAQYSIHIRDTLQLSIANLTGNPSNEKYTWLLLSKIKKWKLSRLRGCRVLIYRSMTIFLVWHVALGLPSLSPTDPLPWPLSEPRSWERRSSSTPRDNLRLSHLRIGFKTSSKIPRTLYVNYH